MTEIRHKFGLLDRNT